MLHTYIASLLSPLQLGLLYCLVLYAAYIQGFGAATAPVGSCVVWGIMLFMPHPYRASLLPPLQQQLLYSMGHYAFHALYLQRFCAAAASIVFVVQFGTLCFLCSILTEPRCCRRYSTQQLVQFWTLCFLCFIPTVLLCCRRYTSISFVVWGTMLFMLHTYRASVLPPLQQQLLCSWGTMLFMLHTYRASELPPLQQQLLVQFGTLCFLCFILTGLRSCRRYSSSCCSSRSSSSNWPLSRSLELQDGLNNHLII